MNPIIEKTYLTGIPHEGSTRTFQYPAFRGTYGSVAKQIDKEGLARPNSPETASLIYDAKQNAKGKFESEILDILRDAWLWEFTGNLYLPKSNKEVNNGVILESNPRIVNGKLSMNKKSLIQRLNENDPLVKFVPFGYKIEEQTWQELGKNPYIVARYGEQGAEKIAEIASKCRYNPRLWSFNFVDGEEQRMSAVSDGDFGYRLGVDGDSWGDGGDGLAFGVKK